MGNYHWKSKHTRWNNGTGIASHPDLDANLALGYSFLASGDPVRNNIDVDGHGTHVAGIVGAVGNNEIGVTGVNWNVTLVQLRVGTTGFNRVAIVRALNWAKNNWNTPERVSIINLSFGEMGHHALIMKLPLELFVT